VSTLEELRAERLKKLSLLKEQGINAYPVSTHPDFTLKDASVKFDEIMNAGKPVTLVGRILSIRGQGKISFFTFDDGTGRFQALLKFNEPTPEDIFTLFTNAFDMGDFIEVTGTLFLSKQGEKTILGENVRMLGKSLLPLPEKWSGLQDVEERFRKRYLDLISNPEVKERFILRSKLVTEIRRFLDTAGFLEVETPALQPMYGGASAEPFVTHHNTLDTDLYLRISDELYLKRLLAGGLPKVYEIARDFRNEGIDTTHNPEFTMLEFYEAYSDAERQRAFVEALMKKLALVASSDGVIEYNGEKIDFTKEFKVTKYADCIVELSGIKDPLSLSTDELLNEASRLGVHVEEGASSVKILDTIFKKFRPQLIQPLFLIDYPVDMLPLTKRKEGEENIVDAFQMYAGGIELVKAFSELNDPLDQRARFEAQEKFKEGGEADAQVLDEDFLEAMEHGIPPAGGVGIGIDRLCMLFTNTTNIKEVILFPTLKPRE
jgi:lysyl-tRNA synthetase class 2